MGVSVREKVKGSGTWYLWVRHAGERAALKYTSEEEARDVAKAVRHAIALGQFDIAALKKQREPTKEEPTVMTLKDYFETRFDVEYLVNGVRKSTRDSYRGAFNHHILPELGNKPIDQITRAHVKPFVGSLTKKTYKRILVEKTKDAEGNEVRKETVVERPLSKSSIRIITATLCVCMNHAKEDGLIRENPANRLAKLFRQAKAMHPEIQPLTAVEVPLFLQAAREHTPDYYTMFLMLLHTGVRSGECAGLQWGDLDFNSKFVIIRRTVTPSRRIEKTKTDRVRRIDMSDELAMSLESHRRDRLKKWMRKDLKEGEVRKPFPDWVFANEEGGPPDMHNVKRRAFQRALEKACLRRIRMHDLRHSYASILISAGVSPAYVQLQLGHASIKMTVDTYTHLIPGAGRQALAALPGIGSPSTTVASSSTSRE